MSLFGFFQGQSVKYALAALVLVIYLFLAIQNINTPFIHVSEDTNGSNGMAGYNWAKYGLVQLKGGLYVSWLSEQTFSDDKLVFYADHPMGFLIPTWMAYKIFGAHEWTTRLGPLVLMILALGFLFFALEKIFKNPITAFFCLLGIVLLPGAVYYGKHLDMSPPSLAMAMISFSLFIFYFYHQTKKDAIAFFISILLGCLTAWHFYFMPFSIWLFLLFTKKGKGLKGRRLFIYLLPVIVVITFVFNVLQVSFLAGGQGLAVLKSSFLNRSGASSFLYGEWYQTIFSRWELNFTWWFLVLAFGGLIYLIFLPKFKNQRDLLLPLGLMPLFVLIVFQQWSTHPFGPIYFIPAVGILSGLLLWGMIENWKLWGILSAGVLLALGIYFSLSRLSFFYNNFLILQPQDIELLKQSKASVIQGRLCVGANQWGLYYGGIISWYWERELEYSPQCLESTSSPLAFALVFRGPSEFYEQEALKFMSRGLVLNPSQCSPDWCLMTAPK
jgi:hypothetical protein